jgi:hypothetical protein
VFFLVALSLKVGHKLNQGHSLTFSVSPTEQDIGLEGKVTCFAGAKRRTAELKLTGLSKWLRI